MRRRKGACCSSAALCCRRCRTIWANRPQASRSSAAVHCDARWTSAGPSRPTAITPASLAPRARAAGSSVTMTSGRAAAYGAAAEPRHVLRPGEPLRPAAGRRLQAPVEAERIRIFVVRGVAHLDDYNVPAKPRRAACGFATPASSGPNAKPQAASPGLAVGDAAARITVRQEPWDSIGAIARFRNLMPGCHGKRNTRIERAGSRAGHLDPAAPARAGRPFGRGNHPDPRHGRRVQAGCSTAGQRKIPLSDGQDLRQLVLRELDADANQFRPGRPAAGGRHARFLRLDQQPFQGRDVHRHGQEHRGHGGRRDGRAAPHARHAAPAGPEPRAARWSTPATAPTSIPPRACWIS